MNQQNMITIIDFEASSLAAESYPIQVAWNVDEEVHSHFINPSVIGEWTNWSVSSEAIHGLNLGFLQEHGEHPNAVAHAMNTSLAGSVVYSDAVPYDEHWCQRLFDAAGCEMAFSFSDFWDEVAKYAPSGIRGSGTYGMTEWTNKLLKQARANIGLPDHKADHDVRIRMELFRLAKSWHF